MARLIVHIGLPKTGSTAVQAYLTANHDRLADFGVRQVPAVASNHPDFAVAFDRASPLRRMDVRGTRDRHRARTRLAAQLRREVTGSGTWLVSSEHLATVRTSTDLAALARFLHGFATDVTIVAVLRRGDHWLPSAYAEAIRSGGTRPLGARFVRRRAVLLDHQDFVGRWVAAFGADAVRLVPFLESDKANLAALPARVLAAVGVPASATAGWPLPAAPDRSGLSAEAVEMLRMMNPMLPPPGWRPSRDRARLVAALAERYPGPSTALTADARSALDDAGWVHTGADRLAQAVGDHWPDWRAQPDAAVRPRPQMSEGDAKQLFDELRAAGVVRRGSLDLRGLRRLALRAAGRR